VKGDLVLRILLAGALTAFLGLMPQPAALRPALEAAARSVGSPVALRRVARLQPWRHGLWQQIGLRELKIGESKAAIESLELARQRSELDSAGELALGEAYHLFGDLDKAEATWQNLLGDSQAPPETYSRLYALQRGQGKLTAARQTLVEWHIRLPEDAQATYQLALFELVNQTDQAERLLDSAQVDNPSLSSQILRLKGAIYQAQHTDQESYRLLILGRALANLDQWDLSLPAFEKAAQVSPGYAEAWAFVGEARQHLGKEGWSALERAQSLDPVSVVVQALLALYWRRQGQPEMALSYLTQISQQEPDQPIWQVELGNTLVQKGDLISAAEYFKKATELQPENPLYWQDLARFCVENSYEIRSLGLPAARQASILSPEDPVTLDLMGRVLLSLQDLPTSERFLQLAIQQDAGYAPAHLHLGQLYFESGQYDLAYQHLTLAAKLAGETDSVGQAARRMLSRYFGG